MFCSTHTPLHVKMSLFNGTNKKIFHNDTLKCMVNFPAPKLLNLSYRKANCPSCSQLELTALFGISLEPPESFGSCPGMHAKRDDLRSCMAYNLNHPRSPPAVSVKLQRSTLFRCSEVSPDKHVQIKPNRSALSAQPT